MFRYRNHCFWLLIALSHDYAATITFPVRYINLPDRKVVMNELPERYRSRFEPVAFGFFRTNSGGKRSPIEIDVASKLGGKGGRMMPRRWQRVCFQPDFTRQLGTQVSLQAYEPDSDRVLFQRPANRAIAGTGTL